MEHLLERSAPLGLWFIDNLEENFYSCYSSHLDNLAIPSGIVPLRHKLSFSMSFRRSAIKDLNDWVPYKVCNEIALTRPI